MSLLDQTSLEHVRLRGASVEATVARLRLSSLLASAALQPPGMPPSAVLVVRNMEDPLPGRIARELNPAAVSSGEWERAAQDRLGALYARAARPAWGPVPSSAEAVLFADYSEMLACLAMDLQSSAGHSWWWQSVRRRFSLRLGSWVRIWEEHPEYVPSALEHLAARNQAVAVLERIPLVQAWRLLRMVARAFGLPDTTVPESPTAVVHPAVASPSRSPERHSCAASSAAGDSRHEEPKEAQVRESPRGAAPGHPLRPPWEPYVPREASPETLGIERRALLGVALLLRRSPQVAFTTGFPVQFQTWLAAEERATREAPSEPRSTAAAPDVSPLDSTAKAGTAPPLGRGSVTPGGSLPSSGSVTSQGDRKVSRDQRERSEPRVAAEAGHTGAVQRREEWEAGRVTQAGGVLYLIHLLRQAELLRRFETGLGGWELLELVVRCLLGPAFWKIAADPVWAALAELDEREPEVPAGTGFQAQMEYAAPESWLRDLPDCRPLVRFRARGVELWRPEGFLILDSPAGGVPAGSSVVPLSAGQRRGLRTAAAVWPVCFPLAPELRRFLHFVLPYARWRLRTVLRGASLEEVCLRRGKLILSSSHVDLVMGMRQISVPVRMAGLDANPGWVPELGRVVTFHFVEEGWSGE
ncbi:MAG: hypothetical protein LAQ69_20840 [Acidobacteriia bacterium]|nr:hypothetical protein [Terriglobia bacterium]